MGNEGLSNFEGLPTSYAERGTLDTWEQKLLKEVNTETFGGYFQATADLEEKRKEQAEHLGNELSAAELQEIELAHKVADTIEDGKLEIYEYDDMKVRNFIEEKVSEVLNKAFYNGELEDPFVHFRDLTENNSEPPSEISGDQSAEKLYGVLRSMANLEDIDI